MINTEAIEDVTHDPEEWRKFWYESDEEDCYSPLKSSTSVRG